MRFAFSLVVALLLGGGNIAAQAVSESCPPLLQHLQRQIPDVFEDGGVGQRRQPVLQGAKPEDRQRAELEFSQVPDRSPRAAGVQLRQPYRARAGVWWRRSSLY